MKDLKPLLIWAKANGESKVIDRILIKTLPELIKQGYKITPADIDTHASIEIPTALFEQLQKHAEDIVGAAYPVEGE